MYGGQVLSRNRSYRRSRCRWSRECFGETLSELERVVLMSRRVAEVPTYTTEAREILRGEERVVL